MVATCNEPKVTFQLTLRGRRLEVRVEAPGGEGKANTTAPTETPLAEIDAHDPAKLPSSVVERVGDALYT